MTIEEYKREWGEGKKESRREEKRKRRLEFVSIYSVGLMKMAGLASSYCRSHLVPSSLTHSIKTGIPPGGSPNEGRLGGFPGSGQAAGTLLRNAPRRKEGKM